MKLQHPAPRRTIALTLAGVVLPTALALVFLLHYPWNRPVTYADDTEHFKYGSLGADLENGLPRRILEVLPGLFPQHLPKGAPRDYTAFGFVQEPGHQLPIGFSERTHLVPLTGFNCAACHTGVLRHPATGQTQIILGMGSTTVDLQRYFEFLFAVAADSRFNPDTILAAMEQREHVPSVDRILYRRIVPLMKRQLAERKAQLESILGAGHPRFGPGRVDTFNPYKLIQLAAAYPDGLTPAESYGAARYASIWSQGLKQHFSLNWDGNAPSIRDRNVGAAFGAGATPQSVDHESLERVQRWLVALPPPPYPFAVSHDSAQLARGQQVFRRYCFDCHDARGSRVGQVTPIEAISTDRHRLDSYTEKLNTLFRGMGLDSMTKTNGYLNEILDGVWARAPYLHNGSVPTLWDLLTPAGGRNRGRDSFLLGHGVYDSVNVGVRTEVTDAAGQSTFRFDLTAPGNSNGGHSGPAYGTELSPSDKRALVEFLKTL